MPITRSHSAKRRNIELATDNIAPSTSNAENKKVEAPPTVEKAPSVLQIIATTTQAAQPSEPVATKTLSRRSSKSSRAQRLAQAKEDLFKLQVELATARFARLQAEEDDSDNDIATQISENETRERISTWLNESQAQLQKNETDRQYAPSIISQNVPHSPPPADERRQPPPATCTQADNNNAKCPETQQRTSQKNEITELITAITTAFKSSHRPRYFTDLPNFSGAHQEWLSFKAAYYESAALFSDVENSARLRRNIRGRAREAVENLLIHHAQPQEVMKTLEARFGRPDCIATTELDRLRALPRPADTPKDICIFASRVANIVAALKALKKIHYLYNPEITKIKIEKLPSTLRYRWFDFAATQHEEEPDLLKIARFLERETELCSPYAQPEIIAPQNPQENNRPPRRYQRTLTTTVHKKCPACQDGHRINDCKKFIEADVNGRWDIAKENRLCFRCLRYRSNTHNCRRIKCDIDGCQYYHNKLLYYTKENRENNTVPEAVASTWTRKNSQSYLKMVSVRIAGPAGEIETWALLDDGSTVTLIDSELAEQVGARGPIDPLHIEAIANSNIAASTSRRVSLTLRGATEQHKICARTINQLRLSPQEITEEDLNECTHLEDIKDHLKYQNAAPKLLIGQDNWHLLLASEVRKGQRYQPVASHTPLGWVLHGAHTRTLGQCVNFVHNLKTQDDNMNEQLKLHFAIDNLMIQPRKPQNDPEQRAMKLLQENTTQTEDGHYQSALLWKTDATTMPNNYDSAMRRLTIIERKLEKNPQIKEKYSEQMEALITRGYAELAPSTKSEGKTWYLPHFAVTNPMKPEKMRIVHDAAAKTAGVSLNDQLLTGPDLLQSLPGVLMRFRRHRIAVSADISEMFMQVKIRPEDRDYLRYLWRKDSDYTRPPHEYRMTSLIFGATSSPSTAIFVKNVNAMKYENIYPEAAAAIVKNHYVDDYLDSYETIEDAARIAKQVRDIHREAHFGLRKWTSNSPEAIQELIEHEQQVTAKTLADCSNNERVLGLVWKPQTDELTFNLDLARVPEETLRRDAPTKREALRIVMSLYDPLGLASPVTIQAKNILQEVWRRGTGWDEQLDTDVSALWRSWITHLQNLRHISVPRCYLQYSDATSLQLHIFVDASETAYAAALYWRAVTPDGRISMSLITAKARVAPLKLTSIPRLELQAAVMGSRMAATVIEEHDRKPEKKIFWTDSKTVLTWLKTGSRSYKPFVAHRIAAIEEHSTVHEWRWIPTKMNVADDATRNVPQDFNKNHRWYTGPGFLLQDESSWPTERPASTDQTGEEKCNYTTNKTPQVALCVPDSARFSKWEKLLRASARVLQFIELCRPEKHRTHYKRTRKNKQNDPDWKRPQTSTTPLNSKRKIKKSSNNFIEIDISLLRRAENLLIRASQEETFMDEISALRNNQAISRGSRLRSLSLIYVNGVIRLNSRINTAVDLTDAQRAPPVLDGNDRRTKLWIEHTHRQLLHAGVETTINECRQHYWILRMRPITKSVINACLPCRIRKDTPPQPPTGDHPSCRLAHHRRPFTYTGLDYFGPITVTNGRSTLKRYVAIFTCLTTRAVHLELAASLSTDSAVMALRRMIARRGCPTEIWSDNGTNLHGADRELRKAIEHETSKRMISWRYIPPGAPFMGGAWERLVRSVKTALAATQQSRHPTDEVLSTLLAEAEYTVNSRPLTHVSVSYEDPEAITPNHFLLGGSARVPTPGTFTDHDLIKCTHWRAAQRLADIFWARWVREYLPELQNRREPHGHGRTLKIGDIVLIVDNTLPRNVWPRGIITATFPGRDGVVRVADVRTKSGILRRPTKKIVVIPTEPAALQPGCNVATDDARREECSGRPQNKE